MLQTVGFFVIPCVCT